MRGRKPRPKAEKIAKGTRKSRINYDEPEPDAPESTTPPAGLKGAGLQLWKAHAAPMVKTGQLRTTDVPLFTRHCRTVTDIERWRKDIEKPGIERTMLLRMQSTIDRLESLAVRQASELGMGPVSRSRVKTVTKAKVAQPKEDRFFAKGVKPRVVDGGRA